MICRVAAWRTSGAWRGISQASAETGQPVSTVAICSGDKYAFMIACTDCPGGAAAARRDASATESLPARSPASASKASREAKCA